MKNRALLLVSTVVLLLGGLEVARAQPRPGARDPAAPARQPAPTRPAGPAASTAPAPAAPGAPPAAAPAPAAPGAPPAAAPAPGAPAAPQAAVPEPGSVSGPAPAPTGVPGAPDADDAAGAVAPGAPEPPPAALAPAGQPDPGVAAAIDRAAAPLQPIAEDGSRVLVQEDVTPDIAIYERPGLSLHMGGLVQMHLAALVGEDSLLSNSDLANREGFRLRRARIGVEGLFGPKLRLLLVVNPLESDPEVGTVSDARMTYTYAPWMQISIGTDKVPFSRAGLESSRRLSTIERPLSISEITPDRRLGATIEGRVLDQRLAYLVAFMNGTEGYELGNQFGGFLYAARVQYALWGMPSSRAPARDGLSVGFGSLLENGPATMAVAVSADILLAIRRAAVRVEAVCDRTAPQDSPETSPEVSDTVDRCGAYVEVGYTLPQWWLQPVVRAEVYDDDRAIDDAGDAFLVSVGANARLSPHARVQLHYLGRFERSSEEQSNDALILNLQGSF